MSITANVAYCEHHGLHGEREECYVCGVRVKQIPLSDTAWLLWGRPKSGAETALIGSYISREVALDAQGSAEIHANGDLYSDFWVTPWPLRTAPSLGSRMEMKR